MKPIYKVAFFALLLLPACNRDLKNQLAGQGDQIKQLKAERKELNVQLQVSNQKLAALQADLEQRDQNNRPTAEDKAMRNGLQQSLANEVAKGQVSIEGKNRSTLIHLDDSIFFSSGSAAPRPQGIQVLEKLSKELKKYQGYALLVEGHTDSMQISQRLRLRFATNQELASARALAVSYYLEHELRVRMPMIAISYGAYQEMGSNRTKRGRAKNRRVQLTLIPKGQKLY